MAPSSMEFDAAYTYSGLIQHAYMYIASSFPEKMIGWVTQNDNWK